MRALYLVLIAVAVLAAGCCGTINEQFVKAVDVNWGVVSPEYKAYLEADESLSPKSKELRLKTIEEFSELIKEAKKETQK